MGRKAQRYGKFLIPGDWVDDERQHPVLMAIMGQCVIVVRAEYLYVEDKISYHALSPKFRELAVGEIVPTYKIVVAQNLNGPVIDFVEEKP